jgi:hypothetical protein
MKTSLKIHCGPEDANNKLTQPIEIEHGGILLIARMDSIEIFLKTRLTHDMSNNILLFSTLMQYLPRNFILVIARDRRYRKYYVARFFIICLVNIISGP